MLFSASVSYQSLLFFPSIPSSDWRCSSVLEGQVRQTHLPHSHGIKCNWDWNHVLWPLPYGYWENEEEIKVHLLMAIDFKLALLFT